MSYFVIKCYEDGPSFHGPYTKEQLEKEIQEEIDDGTDYEYEELGLCKRDIWFDEFPCRTAYVIKGESVIPRSKEVIVETELP